MLSKFLCARLETFTCADGLRKFRWKQGVECPAWHARRIGRRHDQNSADIDRYRWAHCGTTFTDTTGTIFEQRQATLPAWLMCSHVMSLNCSTHEIAEELRISYDLADSLVKRLGQRVFDRPAADTLVGHVDIDEAYRNAGEQGVAHTERDPRRRANDRRGRGTMETDRPPILGIVQRGGCLRLHVRDNVQKKTIDPVIEEGIPAGSTLSTDEYRMYTGLTDFGYRHQTVTHSNGDSARGEVHGNTSEGIWSIVRQGLRAHRGVAKKFLNYYVAIVEFFYHLKRAAEPPLECVFQTIC